MKIEPGDRTSAYQGPVLCQECRGVMQEPAPGFESAPPSHGICRDCWSAWRAANNLKPRPYPTAA